MKLPQNLQGIQREGRSDSFQSHGVEPAFLGGVKDWIKKKSKSAACWACKKACNATVC